MWFSAYKGKRGGGADNAGHFVYMGSLGILVYVYIYKDRVTGLLQS